MKVVLLLAGKGRRLRKKNAYTHKSLLRIDRKPILAHLMERMLFCGFTDFVPVLGYKKEEVLEYLERNYGGSSQIEPVFNMSFGKTNNLYSLWKARDRLEGKEFLVCNGDLVLNKFIVKSLMTGMNVSSIAIDDVPRNEPIDSPGIITKDSRVLDLGRHIPFNKSPGYAIGLYRFNKALSRVFFSEAEKMLEINLNAGFHDPLRNLFNKYPVFLRSTGGLLWTDVDTDEDLVFARHLLKKIIVQENEFGV